MITILMELKEVKFAISFKCQNIWYTCMCTYTHTYAHQNYVQLKKVVIKGSIFWRDFMNGDRVSKQAYMAQALSLTLEKRRVQPIAGSANYAGVPEQRLFRVSSSQQLWRKNEDDGGTKAQ